MTDKGRIVALPRLHSVYGPSFFSGMLDLKTNSAQCILPRLLEFTSAESIIDVGCGTGTWLSVCRELGIEDVWGIDGPWVRDEDISFPRERFQQIDLSCPFQLSRTFDLAISLEVGEHLPPESAYPFVCSLTRLAPVVVFSAAIPGQRGTDHLNEQWPAYWARLFAQEGYVVVDALRREIWEREDVAPWYKQNTMIYVREPDLGSYPLLASLRSAGNGNDRALALVHPVHFVTHLPGVRSLIDILWERGRSRFRLRTRLRQATSKLAARRQRNR